MVDQAQNLRRMLQRNNSFSSHAKTIVVTSGKGGVGKSNISLNLALDLTRRHNKVLLFDLDVGMGNIDVLLDLDTSYSIVDYFEGSHAIHDMIVQGPGGLSCIAGGSGLNQVFVADEAKRNRFYSAYSQLINDYDYIILDMGAGATEDSLLFMLAADECFVIATPEPTAIMDAYSMVKHLVLQGFAKPIYILMNRAHNDRQGYQALNHFVRVVKQFLHIDIYKLGVLPEDKLVSQSVINQTPFLFINEKAPISRAIKQVVQFYLNGSTKEPSGLSFVQKLKTLMTDRNR